MAFFFVGYKVNPDRKIGDIDGSDFILQLDPPSVRHVNKQSKSDHNINEGLQQQLQTHGDVHFIELNLVLQAYHFSNGQLHLRCIAQIPGIYNDTADAHVGPGSREPVPERGENNSTNSLPSKSFRPQNHLQKTSFNNEKSQFIKKLWKQQFFCWTNKISWY